jgi:lysophospholipase L1-like esterase
VSRAEFHKRTRLYLRKGIAVFGAVLTALALLVDVVGMSGAGISSGQILLGLSGIAILGLALLGRWVVSVYRASAFMLLNTVLLIIGLEIGFRAVEGVYWWMASRQPSAAAEGTNIFELSNLPPYYASQEWSSQHWAEWVELNAQNRAFSDQSYVEWRTGPYDGETIFVDETFTRRTPGADCGADSYTVFAFGGSTMWGVGAPDELTIPAYLQAGLEAVRDEPICVVNFAQLGYVSTQSVIALILELQREHIPDAVIFYDGVNEVRRAYNTVQKEAAENAPEDTTSSSRDALQEAGTLPSLLSGSRLAQWVWNLSQPSTTEDSQSGTTRTLELDPNELADDIAKIYLTNYRLLDDLSRDYGFEFYFFWQPVIFVTGKRLTQEELRIIQQNQIAAPGMAELYDATYQRIGEALADYPHLYAIHDVLDDQESQVFIDSNHITPEGNQIVAEEMLRIIAFQ